MQKIIKQIHQFTGRDLSTYANSFLQMTVSKRITETSSDNTANYLGLLKASPEEVDQLLDSLNISYSLFFRDPLDYSIIERFILPSLFHRKGKDQSSSVRIWSAGCADGPEPYTLSIIGDELTQKFSLLNPPLIFATDLSEKALNKARIGNYNPASLQNVKLKQIGLYFSKTDQVYHVSEHLKKHIEFSRYDLLGSKTGSPPSGIFGGFDMVTCCNLMMYYKREIQEMILGKIYHSLANKGFLMVDSSEKSLVKTFGGFRLYSALSNIFVKN